MLVAAGDGWAASKDECLDAHSRGQDLREAGRLTSARQTFLACAQSSCPALIQADCARFSEELDRLVPTVSFGARDPGGVDLPDTTVYVDDQLMTMRLDDGKSYDLDPGKHAVRFVHEGRETAITIVLNQGEKGRSVVATFADPAAEAARSTPSLTPAAAQAAGGPWGRSSSRASAPLRWSTGAVLVVVGLKEVPSDCSVGSGQCIAPPGDPSIRTGAPRRLARERGARRRHRRDVAARRRSALVLPAARSPPHRASRRLHPVAGQRFRRDEHVRAVLISRDDPAERDRQDARDARVREMDGQRG